MNLKFSDKTLAISDNGEKYSYQDVFESGNRLNNFIKHRSLIICLTNNTIGSLVGYLSFLIHRHIPIMVDNEWDNDYLIQLIATYQPRYIWLPINKSVGFKEYKVITQEFDYKLIKLNVNYEFSINNELGLLLTTSGSTGSPKLVKLTYTNIQSNANSIAEYLNINQNERPITVLPMHYSFGLSIINSHIIMGATILLTNKSIVKKEFWEFMRNAKATSFSGVPYTFEILKKLRFLNMDLPHLKTITQAGGKLNDALNKEFSEYAHRTGKRFFVMYGQTEATARMSYLPPERSIDKLGSMGIAIPGGEFSLIDDNGTPINEPGIVGELVYKGKNVSMGYAVCGDDLAKGDENKGTLVTGDLAKRDNEGFYCIVGRKKRFIKLYGNRINLDETERLIKNIVPDVACAGNDDNMKIFVADQTMVEDVQAYVSTKTGINPRAFEVIFINRIPKNSSGKTIYSKLPAIS